MRVGLGGCGGEGEEGPTRADVAGARSKLLSDFERSFKAGLLFLEELAGLLLLVVVAVEVGVVFSSSFDADMDFFVKSPRFDEGFWEPVLTALLLCFSIVSCSSWAQPSFSHSFAITSSQSPFSSTSR
jgi:hypothetical protein